MISLTKSLSNAKSVPEFFEFISGFSFGNRFEDSEHQVKKFDKTLEILKFYILKFCHLSFISTKTTNESLGC